MVFVRDQCVLFQSPWKKTYSLFSLLPFHFSFRSLDLKYLIVQRDMFLSSWLTEYPLYIGVNHYRTIFFPPSLWFSLSYNIVLGVPTMKTFIYQRTPPFWDKFFCGLDMLLFFLYKEFQIPFIKPASKEVKWLMGQEGEFRLNTLWRLHCLCILFDVQHSLKYFVHDTKLTHKKG